MIMKFLKIFPALLLLSAMWTACEDDTDPRIPADAVAPMLTAPTEGGEFVLLKVNESDVFQTFEWNDADLKLNVVTTYDLEVDGVDGDFSNNKYIAKNITSPYKIKVTDFNKGLLGAGFEDGISHRIKVRIKAANYLASEVIEMTVTPYFDAEPWSIIGSAVGGWDVVNDQYMNYDKVKQAYVLTLDLQPGEFKFRAPKVDEDNPWKSNYGLKGSSAVYENDNDVELKADGDNVKTLGGNYTITLDVANKKFSIKQNSASSMTNWTDVVLDVYGQGVSVDNSSAVADGDQYKLIADSDGKPSVASAVYTWTWKNVALEENAGFKIRTKDGVESPVNGALFEAGYSALDEAASSSKVVELINGDLSVTAKGNYDITITIDATNGDVKKIIIKDPYPANLYMIGDAVGNWNWDETDLAMVPVNGTPSQFWKIVWLKGSGGFKFSPVKDWKGDFGAAEGSAGEGEFAFGGSNITPPATAGYYMVVVDYNKQKIAVSPVKVYLMGETVGSWDAGVEANLFAVDNANEVVTLTKTLSPGNLRMYAWHDWFSDWWRSEFNVIGGDIVMRGNGGDQDPVAIEANNYKIDLNFKTMKGTLTPQ
ncbi:MAG: SusF/SusE family outer membrane protein [Marinilabiliaceae bacterium]|nr:SusF/SusE family outer membrane protein [Marinilabiliaceae bacterium]